MNPRQLTLIIVTMAFSALTVAALMEGGVSGILAVAFGSFAGMQIFFDLVIVCALAIIWMVVDARARNANPWPFVVITLLAGSFGPLLYLIVRERSVPVEA